ncbi:MAG: trigger factor [Methylococcaceae bacterium]|nr:trigger factor [Methylococcaceae bacterium]
MQVSVESTSELGRKMTVHLPEEKIQVQVDSRLQNLARQAKIDGFRPGKVPASIIRQRYGSGVRQEVVTDLIQSSFYEAVQAEKLNPAAGPTITPNLASEGEGFSYIADFEVLPEVATIALAQLQVKKFVSAVGNEDLDAMVLKLRGQRKTWREVERPAALEDRLTISFQGEADGSNFTDGTVEDFHVVLGSNQLIPGFEDKLVGRTANSEDAFTLDFPADYGAAHLAGKTAEFKVKVSKIEESVLPELDEEFVKSFGIESGLIDDFRADIKSNMEREMTRALQARTKTSVMDALYSSNAALTLPAVMVSQELDSLIKPYVDTAKKNNQPIDQDALRQRLEPTAKRRVVLGLALGKLMEDHNVKADPKRVRAVIDDIALSYEDPQQVVNWYYSNKEQLSQVEGMVLEDQVVDIVLSHAQVTEEQIPFGELMQPQSGA